MRRSVSAVEPIKTSALFSVTDPGAIRSPRNTGYLAKDPAGKEVLNRIGASLAERGYRVTPAKPTIAVGFHGAICCKLSRFLEADLLLSIIEHHDGLVQCLLWAIPVRPIRSRLLFGKRPTQVETTEEFRRLLQSISDEVVNRLGATSFSWLSEEEAVRLTERELKGTA